MKAFSLPLLCLGMILLALPAHAGSHKKNKTSGDSSAALPPPVASASDADLPPETAPTVNPGDLPSVSLQPFLDKDLSNILAPLDAPGLSQPELVAGLRTAYASGMTAAPAARKSAYLAAQGVCNALLNAMNERKNAVTALRGATATHTSAITQPRGGTAQGQAEGRNSDNFFVSSQKNNWVQRATALRQNIVTLYLREREMERQSAAIPPATAPAGGARAPIAPAVASPASAPTRVAPATAPAAATPVQHP